MEESNIEPSLRETNNSTATQAAPLSAESAHRSPTYQDRVSAASKAYTANLLSTYDDSPISNQHHGSYPPLTPQSAHADGTSENHGENSDHKRPRACEACRGLKVKCESDPSHPDSGPCKRCTKANRNCVVTVPSRKRQKKTDGRVAELEKKIDALTATLQASKSSSLGHDDRREALHSNERAMKPFEQAMSGGDRLPEQADWRQNLFSKVTDGLRASPSMATPPMVVAGQKRKLGDFSSSTESSTGSVPAGLIPPLAPRTGFTNPKAPKGPASNDYTDVIDRGITTSETASQMFDHYVNDMSVHIPAVVFPPGTTAAEIRKSKPILFLAVLSVGSSGHAELQRALTKEVMQIFADRIICYGEKNLELIQAILISSLWYWPPEHFEELKFYQLIHIAAVMAIDIGLGRKQESKRHRAMAGLWRDHPWRRTPFPDSESVESRRTWLACYFMCCTASMGFRRPNLIRWTPFMSESIDVLYNSPNAMPSDKLLCEWVKSQHIAEHIGVQFSMDDPSATVQLSEPKVQFALKGFERDLEHWASHVPVEVKRPSLKICEYVINLYMHEVALHVEHNVEEFRPPFTEEKLCGLESKDSDPLSAAHISALSVCLTSIDGIFETFLSLEVDVIRSLPMLLFVRAAYAVIVLIKMYFSATSSNSELGRVIDKDHMKVEQYLNGLLEKFRTAAEDDRCRPASKFLMVLVMLKTWFQRQKEGKPSRLQEYSGAPTKDPTKTENSASPTRDGRNHAHQSQILGIQSRSQGEYSPNTPLQLLSEVATEKQTRNYENNNITNSENTSWQAQQPYQYTTNCPFPPSSSQTPTLNPGTAAPQANMTLQQQNWNPNGYDYSQNNNNSLPPGILPSGMDLEYAMGDGFEQAMGITLGYSDFGKYFEDDQLFNGFIDNFGTASGTGFGGGG